MQKKISFLIRLFYMEIFNSIFKTYLTSLSILVIYMVIK